MKATEIYNSTRDANGQFKTGYRATIGTKYVTIEYLTNRQGDRDAKWRVSIKYFDVLSGDTSDKIYFILQNVIPCWQGKKIQ